LNRLDPSKKCIIWRKILECFHQKP